MNINFREIKLKILLKLKSKLNILMESESVLSPNSENEEKRSKMHLTIKENAFLFMRSIPA